MCSLLFSTKPINNLSHVNEFLAKRGPDNTNHVIHKNHNYVHNLLSITGAFTIQPLFGDDVAVLFNGEIYNFKEFGDYDNDSKCIAPLYEQYGKRFIEYIDGEYAIVVVDYKNNTILFTSDVFGTKPLFYAINAGSSAFTVVGSGASGFPQITICEFTGNTATPLRNNTQGVGVSASAAVSVAAVAGLHPAGDDRRVRPR